jgi:hypothetical protein
MRTNFSVWMIFLLTGIFGCSTAKFGWEKEPAPGSETQPVETVSGMIEDFDPLSLDEDEIRVTPIPEEQEAPAQTLTPAVPEDTVSESEWVPGFRVQLLAVQNEQNAFEAQKRAIFKFSQKVYLDFQAPYYRIYVGDFLESQRREADALVEEARRKGFPEAWRTPARVNPQNVPKTY